MKTRDAIYFEILRDGRYAITEQDYNILVLRLVELEAENKSIRQANVDSMDWFNAAVERAALAEEKLKDCQNGNY